MSKLTEMGGAGGGVAGTLPEFSANMRSIEYKVAPLKGFFS